MTMKPFEIQSTALSIGGVKIDTSATGTLVLPGVTRAGTSVAIEVNDTQDQTVPWTGTPVVIDGYTYAVYITGEATGLVGWTSATYAIDGLDGEGFIDGISVVSGGSNYTGEAVTFSEIMWAAPEGTPIDNTTNNGTTWIQIPFSVRCGAGTIQSEFGSGGSGTGSFGTDLGIGSNYDSNNPAVLFSNDDMVIRTGGTADTGNQNLGAMYIAASEDLFIGHAGNLVDSTYPSTNDYTTYMNFGTNGTTVSIVAGTNTLAVDAQNGLTYNGSPVGGSVDALYFQNAGSITGQADASPGRYNIVIDAEKDIVFNTNEDGEQFRFTKDGTVIFPDGSTQSTAYTGQSGSSSGELYLFVNADGTVITSADGITWGAPVTTGVPTDVPGNHIGKAEVHGGTIVYTRSDAGVDTFIPQTGLYFSTTLGTATLCAGTDTLFGDSLYWNEVRFFAETARWVSVGYAQGSIKYPVVAHSLDGITWTVVPINWTFFTTFNTVNADWILTDVAFNTISNQYVISSTRNSIPDTYGGIFVTSDITTQLDDTNYVILSMNGVRLAYWSLPFFSAPGMIFVIDKKQNGEYGLWQGSPTLNNNTGLLDSSNWVADFGSGTGNGWYESAMINYVGYVPEVSEIAYNQNVFIVTTIDGQVFVQPNAPATFVTLPLAFTSTIHDIIRNDSPIAALTSFTTSPALSAQNANWSAFNNQATTASQSGNGTATFNIVIDGTGTLTTFDIVSQSGNFLVGDTITFLGAAFGGTTGVDDIVVTVTGAVNNKTIIQFNGETPAADGEKISISGVTNHDASEPGTSNQSYNITLYIKHINNAYELYNDNSLTSPWDTSTFWPVVQDTGTITWSHGQFLDAAGAAGDILYVGNDDEQVFRSIDSGQTWTLEADVTGAYFNDFAYGTFGSGVSLNELVNGRYTVTLDSDGNLNLPDGSSSSLGRLQTLNGYPTLMAYGGESGHGGPELDWMDSNNPTADFSSSTTLRHTMYLNNGSGLYLGMNENETPGHFSGNWQFDTNGVLTLPAESIVGSFVNDTSNGSYNLWFSSSVTGPNGVVYAIGGEDNTNDYFVVAQNSTSTLWKKAFNYQDLSDGTGANRPLGMNIKFDVTNNLVLAGFDSGNSTGVVALNPNNGNQTNSWIVNGGTDGTQVVSQKSFTIDPAGNPIIVGHSFGGYIPFNGLTATTGTDGSGQNYITVALTDISNPHPMYRWWSNYWQVDISGTGNWYEPTGFNMYNGIPVAYSGTPGTGGIQTATEGSSYSTGGLTGSTNVGMDLDVTKWSDSNLMNAILSLTNGVHFTIVIGSLTPGVAQTVLNFSSVSDWNGTGPGIFHMDGNWSVVSGSGNIDSAATDILSISYGSVMLVDVSSYIQWDGGLYASEYTIRDVGTNYQNGDTLKVLGSLLGGRDGEYILSATPITGNGTVWYFSQTDYPTMDIAIPAGTLFRFNGPNNLGQTVTSVVDNGDGTWAMTVTGGQTALNSIDFFAGNDAIFSLNGSYLTLFAWLPSETARFPMSQTITTQSTYNVRRQEGQQAFIWTSNWVHTFGVADQNEEFDDVVYDPVNNTIFASGYFYQPGINAQQLVIALDATTGATKWQKFVGDNNVDNYGYAGSIGVDSQGNVITIGTNDNGQAMITKQNGVNGSVMWQTVQTNQNNWDNEPLGKIDSNGDVYYGDAFYDNNIGHRVLNLVKLNGTDGSLQWARIVDDTQGYQLRSQWDTFQQTVNLGDGQVQWAGYVYDINENYWDAISVSLPQSGTGVGMYGRWIVSNDTNISLITGNDSFVVDPNTVYVATDSLTFNVNNPSVSFYDASGSVISIDNIKLGGGAIVFPDGSDIAQAGVARALKDTGDNTTYLNFSHNGKFLYFYGYNGNSTVRVPQNYDQALPIGFTVTLILDDFGSNTVYVNTGGDTTNGLHIGVNGLSATYNNSNWWRCGSWDNNVGVYTLMKVDTNRWVFSGPNVQDDS